ncbi:MAG: ABC transporter ATP-binding protein [Actinocatenispora sp.]
MAVATTEVSARAGRTSPGVRISDLTVAYRTQAGELPAVSGVSLELAPGSITGLVGESGSGKSTMALSMLNAVQSPGRITGGSIEIDGLGDVLSMSDRKIRAARGAEIGYVFQAAQNSLNPLKTVGKQLLDLARSHRIEDKRGLVRQAKELLSRMGLSGERVLDSYQHELSGGMRQRVGIMLALVLNAHVLVLDEPTTALDMISQSNILEIIRDVHAEHGLTTLVVTHDIGVVAEVADRVAVMYGGRLVEQGPTVDVLRSPKHPYTRGLISAIPRLTGDADVARPLPGRPPTLATIPRQGCVFRERCPVYAADRMEACETAQPAALPRADGWLVACHAVQVPVEQPGAAAPDASDGHEQEDQA